MEPSPMTHDARSPGPSLRLVGKDDAGRPAGSASVTRDVDWSSLMARAQEGDRAAYHRLLQEITPYLRSLGARRHRDPNDIVDAVQDRPVSQHERRATNSPIATLRPCRAETGHANSS